MVLRHKAKRTVRQAAANGFVDNRRQNWSVVPDSLGIERGKIESLRMIWNAGVFVPHSSVNLSLRVRTGAVATGSIGSSGFT